MYEEIRSTRKVAFLVHGTLGDYLPAALVCGRLSEGKYDCVFMAPRDARHLVDKYQHVRFEDFGMSMEYAKEHTLEGQLLTSSSILTETRRISGKTLVAKRETYVAKFFTLLTDFWGVMIHNWVPKMLEFLDRETPDLVVLTLGSMCLLGKILRAMQIPTVALLANPMHSTGEHFPTMGIQLVDSMRWKRLNRAMWGISWSLHTKNIRPHLLKALEDRPDIQRIVSMPKLADRKFSTRKLILCSPSFYAAPSDWDPNRARVM